MFLQRVGGTFECVPDGGDLAVKLTTIGGVSVGPKISIGNFSFEAASIDGTTSLLVPLTDTRPFTLSATGTGKVVDIPVAEQEISYTFPATVKITGGLDLTAAGFGAQLTYGEQGTFIAPDAFTTTRRSRGRLRFRPDGTFGARRTIEAIAFDGALPRSRTTVARFRVAPPQRPRRATRMRLAGRRLSWRAARGASSYEIAIRLPDTTTRNLTATRPRVRLPRLPARGRLQVGIVGVNARGEAGPVASSRFKLRR